MLTQEQLAARKAFSKDLPEFDGQPENWPIFISNFEQSSAACGFSNQENLLRLQKALKGDAFNKMRGLLTMPDNVPFIAQTLRDLFGLPDFIIERQIAYIERLSPPKDDKLATLIDFGMAVQILVTTMQTAGLQNHLSDPSLLRKLVSRLTPTLKMNWANYSRGLPSPSLSAFAAWCNDLAVDACLVSSLFEETPKEWKQKGLHVHDEVKPSNSNKDNCPVCSSNCANVRMCPRFLSYDRNRRWRAVKDLRLCRCCLNRHDDSQIETKRSCRVECGEGACKYYHHKLLHNYQGKRHDETHHLEEVQLSHRSSGNGHMFRIVPVKLQNGSNVVHTYAFLDEGSSVTLIDDSLLDDLQLHGPVVPLSLRWTGNTTRVESRSRKVTLSVTGVHEGAKQFPLHNVRSVRNINLLKQSLDINSLKDEFQYLAGLPIASYQNVVPKLLIGMGNWRLGVPLRVKEGKENQPMALKSRLGWTVYGHGNNIETQMSLNFHEENEALNNNLHQTQEEPFDAPKKAIVKQTDVDQGMEAKRTDVMVESTTALNNSESNCDANQMLENQPLCLLQTSDELPNLQKKKANQHERIKHLAIDQRQTIDDQPWKYSQSTAINSTQACGQQSVKHIASKSLQKVLPKSVVLKYPHQLTISSQVTKPNSCHLDATGRDQEPNEPIRRVDRNDPASNQLT